MNPALFTAMLVLVTMLPTYAQSTPLSTKLKELVQLRNQVDSLSHELATQRLATADSERATASQIAHLEMQVRQAQLRNTTLLKNRKRFLEKLEKEQKQKSALTGPLQQTLEILRDHINQGLPYQKANRLQAIDSLEKHLMGTPQNPALTLTRILQFIDDEHTLTREVGLNQQVVTIGGGEVLVDVAHIGMGALYFATNDNRYGSAVVTNGAYSFRLFESEAHSHAIAALFKSLRSGKRTGLMQLPLHYSATPGGK